MKTSKWREESALLRGFRHHRRRHKGQPAIEETLQPGALGHVIQCAIGEVLMPRASARQFEPLGAARRPAMQHRVGHVGVKLQAEAIDRPERLHREVAALRQ